MGSCVHCKNQFVDSSWQGKKDSSFPDHSASVCNGQFEFVDALTTIHEDAQQWLLYTAFNEVILWRNKKNKTFHLYGYHHKKTVKILFAKDKKTFAFQI